jgi:CheY-like chemotaxis protein
MMARVLNVEGYAVVTAVNGHDALRVLGSCRPFVIVLDLEMPVMDGWSFRRTQRGLDPDLASIPIIVCSGSDAIENVAAEMGALACLPKPLGDFAALVDHVEKAKRLAA